VAVDARALLDVRAPGGAVTEAGLRNSVSVALQYLAAWLDGNGAVAIRGEELANIRAAVGEPAHARGHHDAAREFFEAVALGEPFVEFLTLPASDRIDL